MASVTKLKYSISDDEIVIYSSKVLTMFAVAFCIVYALSIAAAYSRTFENSMSKAAFSLIPLLLFGKKVIVSNSLSVF